MDYARSIDCHIAVRGLRAVSDFEYELQIAHANRKISGGFLDTIFITSSMEYAYLSSSAVKEIASFGGDIKQCVPPVVEEEVIKKMRVRHPEFYRS
jgi:pantetheine-phosphate adenylyltransferase